MCCDRLGLYELVFDMVNDCVCKSVCLCECTVGGLCEGAVGHDLRVGSLQQRTEPVLALTSERGRLGNQGVAQVCKEDQNTANREGRTHFKRKISRRFGGSQGSTVV